MPRPQRFCIFCGRPGLTREHVWADWLKKYIPKNEINHTSFSATLHPTRSDFRRKKVAGDLRSRRLRVVCRSCNNGWMSRLQERAKPLLLPLIKGESTAFTYDEQELLAAWITMSIMVAEQFDPYKAVSTKRSVSICEETLGLHRIGEYASVISRKRSGLGSWHDLLCRFEARSIVPN
jgi:hypothetical protein